MKFIEEILAKHLKKFSRLEDKLRGSEGVFLSDEGKNRLKERILKSIEGKGRVSEQSGFEGLIAFIKGIANQIQPSVAFRTLLREKLIAVAEFHRTRLIHFPSWLRGNRKVWVALLVAVFVLTTVFNFTFNIKRVDASVNTVLEEAVGDVVIGRDNQWIPGTDGLLLKVDDVVKTGSDSSAIIKFLDQSVSRLDENTEVKISKLFVNPLNRTETVVELVLNQGRLWSRVISLIDNISHFQVKAKNTVAVARKKAAFDVSVNQTGKAKVVAVQNRVDLVVATDKKVIETTLVKGFTAEVKTNEPIANPQIQPEKTADENDKWVNDNLAKDKKYIEDVKQETQNQLSNQVQVLPGNPLYVVKEFSEGTKIALTLNDLTKQNKILDALQEKFAEAQVLFGKGDVSKAQALLQDFQNQIKAVYDWAKSYEIINPAQASALETKILEMLDTYTKQLTLALPNEPLYTLKESVRQTQLLISGDNVEKKTQEMLSQAGDKLLEAHDLAEQGDSAAATQQVQQYTKEVSAVASEVSQLPAEDKERAVTSMLDNKVEDLKNLETISLPAKQELEQAAPSVQQPLSKALGGSSTLVQPFAAVGTSSLGEGGSSSVSVEVLAPEAIVAGTSSVEIAVSSGTSTTPNAVDLEANKQLQQVVSQAKTDALANIGEAVFDVQKTQPSGEVLKKLENLENIGVNGKPIMAVTLSGNSVFLKSDNTVISVKKTITPPRQTEDSKTLVSPQAKP